MWRIFIGVKNGAAFQPCFKYQFTPLPPSPPPPPPQPDYSQLRSSINRFNSKICFVRLIFVKFTLNELVFRETNKRLCESNDDLRAALEVQKLSFLLFRCCCLFVFLFPSFLHFPLLLSVCNKPTFSLRIVILLSVGWFVCRPWLVKDYRQWNHLRYVNIFFVRFSVLQEIVEPHFPLLPNESDCFLPVNLIQTLLCCRKTMQ